jgi:hypothetical protein
MTPLLHRIAHGQHLPPKDGASLANGQVKAHSQLIRPRQFPVFLRNDQGNDFLTAAGKWNFGDQ